MGFAETSHKKRIAEMFGLRYSLIYLFPICGLLSFGKINAV
jgi:hypothetical protein